MCFLVLPTPRDVKVTGVVHWHSVLFSSHSFDSRYFVRKTVGEESWKAAVLI